MSRPLPLTLATLRALAGVPAPAPEQLRRGGLDRRDFLRAGGALAAFAALSRAPVARALGAPVPAGSLFQLGVASGDPTSTGFVLWTRLAPDPLAGGGMDPVPVRVAWELAHDVGMQQIVRSGEVTATPEEAHTVHVELDGLEPDRWYWYRFHAGADVSPVGRTRTFPHSSVQASRLRFALASCQEWQSGLWPAWHDISLQDLDCVIHVGDYIYEGGVNRNAIRQNSGPEIFSLTDYRNRHAQYKTDPSLQAAHALFPFLVTWDDHEVDNNYAADIQEAGAPRDAFLQRRAAAYQAYWEHMPLRRAQKPVGPDMTLYRFFDYGRLARINVLDTRQYRTDQPCNDLVRVPCPEVYSPAATMVGAAQERWLQKNLLLSRASWNVLAQQVMMTFMDFAAGLSSGQQVLNMDAWDAYHESRRRILHWLARYRVRNTIVLTGDIHSAWAADLRADFADPASPVIGSEFVCTGISSGFQDDLALLVFYTLPANPQIKYFNGLKRGYTLCDVTPSAWTAHFRTVATVSLPVADTTTDRSFVVQNGVPGVQPA